MTSSRDIIGVKIRRLLQTPPESAGVWIDDFGEAFYIALVAELADGRLLHVQEFDCLWYTEPAKGLRPADLVQQEYSLSDVEGHTIIGVTDPAGDFAVALDNVLFLICQCGPGGNYPWIYSEAEI